MTGPASGRPRERILLSWFSRLHSELINPQIGQGCSAFSGSEPSPSPLHSPASPIRSSGLTRSQEKTKLTGKIKRSEERTRLHFVRVPRLVTHQLSILENASNISWISENGLIADS